MNRTYKGVPIRTLAADAAPVNDDMACKGHPRGGSREKRRQAAALDAFIKARNKTHRRRQAKAFEEEGGYRQVADGSEECR